MENSGIVERDGFSLGYSIEGEGIPLMVIGSAVYYRRLFSNTLKSGFRLIFIDHRGHVPSPAGQAGSDLDGLLDRVLDDVEAIREHLGLRDLIVAGHSGNAFLALEYARKYPAEVRKIVLLNTAPSNSSERQQQSIAFFEADASEERKDKFQQDFALLPGDIEREPERRFAHMCIRMGAHSFYDYGYDATAMWEDVHTNMPVIDVLWGDAFARLNMLERLEGLDKPVFIGLGQYDYLIGPLTLWDGIEEKHDYVRKVVFDRSGHNPMLEEPERFEALLAEWIHSVPDRY
ncbi:proline iminopeptidase [Fontibacillus phaseoli]|uniref:Proline iminopeptidase n=1 Tax=Fontibacillus phaseoli TaxID=1416533 RepID=A0A369BP82_9BACL|nr:alpha/beta hydrolase [Fontibacillus phaseoli]RCX23429.1 proline iminopeptidase [Fontibacillus phaseoli]